MFSSVFVSFSVKSWRPFMSRSLDDSFDAYDSSDAVSLCDEVKNVLMVSLMLMLYRVLMHASVPEASVSTPEDVCNRVKKNLTGF